MLIEAGFAGDVAAWVAGVAGEDKETQESLTEWFNCPACEALIAAGVTEVDDKTTWEYMLAAGLTNPGAMLVGKSKEAEEKKRLLAEYEQAKIDIATGKTAPKKNKAHLLIGVGIAGVLISLIIARRGKK